MREVAALTRVTRRDGLSNGWDDPSRWTPRRDRVARCATYRGVTSARASRNADPSEETLVRVLYDDDALYIGIVNLGRARREIVSTQL